MPTASEEYLFDLRGYLRLENAVGDAHLEELNARLDTYLALEPAQWRGLGPFSWTIRAIRRSTACFDHP